MQSVFLAGIIIGVVMAIVGGSVASYGPKDEPQSRGTRIAIGVCIAGFAVMFISGALITFA